MHRYNLLLILLLNVTVLFGQESDQKVPLNSAIRTGVLENGLTYYILHNEEPKDRASFYIVHNVGAIQEEDNQNGLAHFLEHMAFNGTKNFPEKGIINYLEKNGVKFGRNINAYTSRNETVYNISNVPTHNSNLIDSCLLVLNDWSQNLLLTKEEIDAERGVIIEEWRTRRNSRFRISEKKSVLYYDSKFAERDVIGDLEIIKNFNYKTLHKFYKKWYRPDLQAIIIVGDINVDRIENEVHHMFSKLKATKRPAKKEFYDIPDNDKPRYVLATDKEATANLINIQFKYDKIDDSEKDLNYLRDTYSKSIYETIIKERIEERLQQKNPNFIMARAWMSSLYRVKNKASIIVSYKDNNWEKALEDICEIIENTRDFGVTETEMNRAKENLLRSYENSYKKRDKIRNDQYAARIQHYFLTNEPAPGIEFKYNYVKQVVPDITVEEVNKWAQHFFTEKNILIAVTGPESDDVKYPGKDDILNVIDNVKTKKLEPYQDTYQEKALIPHEIVSGSISSVKFIQNIGATEYTLSNGIKVYALKTDIEKEKILFTAQSWGGASKLPEDQIPNYMLFKGFMQAYGVGEFSTMELKKALSGKIVSMRPELGRLIERLSGSSSPQDLETMFQLAYLYFTNPRFDEQAFNALKKRYKAFVANISNDIDRSFDDSVSMAMNSYHPRIKLFSESIVDQIDYESIKDIYLQRFKNPGDFVFMIAGDYNEESLYQFIEKYIASLKTTDIKESYTDHGIRTPDEDFVNHFEVEMTTPKATVYVNYHKNTAYSEEKKIYLYIIGQILNKRYMEEIREKEGGTYGVSVRTNFKENPYQEARLTLRFDCDHEKADKLKNIALNEIQQLIAGNISDDILNDVKKNLIKERTESAEKLNYWYDKVYDYALKNEVLMTKDEFIQFTENVNKQDIINKAQELLEDASKVEIIMKPKNK